MVVLYRAAIKKIQDDGQTKSNDPQCLFPKGLGYILTNSPASLRSHGLMAAKVAPMSVKSLRPIVRFPTFKSNKDRACPGFSLEELKGACLTKNMTKTIGISSDDHRSQEQVFGTLAT